MFDVMESLETWLIEGRRIVVARPVTIEGFGARTSGEALVISGDDTVGELLRGTVSASVRREAAILQDTAMDRCQMVRLEVPGDDAVAAGFPCGGFANVLLQPADSLPPAARRAAREGRPFAIASVVGTADVVVVDSDGSVSGGAWSPALNASMIAEARRLLDGRAAASHLATIEGAEVAFECMVPVPHLTVVGEGVLAEALRAQASMLGWDTTILADSEATPERALDPLNAAGGLVLLTHNPAVDTPVIVAAVRSGIGYIGALGSRRNQLARRARLNDAGLTEQEIALCHGPVGLDIGARNPAETAMAICAEMLAVLRMKEAQSLSVVDGAING